MKWRRVKPNPCEFFWTKMVRGPCHDMPSTSPDDRGRRLFSLDDTMPSLRPLACWDERKYKMFRSILLSFSLPLGRKLSKLYHVCLKVHLKNHFQGSPLNLCVRLCIHPSLNTYKGSVSGWMWAYVVHSLRTLPRSDQGRIPPMPEISLRLPLSKGEALFSPTTP